MKACAPSIINDGENVKIVPMINTIAKNMELLFLLILFYSIFKYIILIISEIRMMNKDFKKIKL